MKPRHVFRLPALAIALPASVLAQSASPPPATDVRPDIEIAADVHMDSIRFASSPRAAVSFTGGDAVATRHDVDRDGLPAPVQGGATYRNVDVRTTISVTLLDPTRPDPAATPAIPDPEESP